MTKTLTIQTEAECFAEITRQVRQLVAESGCGQGACLVYCPHTTAGLTINENADPDVVGDMLLGLREAYPDRAGFRRFEGNSSAHLRASAVGFSQLIPIQNGNCCWGGGRAFTCVNLTAPAPGNVIIQIMEG